MLTDSGFDFYSNPPTVVNSHHFSRWRACRILTLIQEDWFVRSCWLIRNGKAWKFVWNHMIVVSKFRWFSSNSFWFTNFNERLLLFFCLSFYWFIRFWFGAICNWEKLVCVGSRIWTVLSLSWCTGFVVCRVAKYHHVRIWQLIHNIRTAELNS